jgi:UDP-3-O-[3-hydroxymyristoyl] glucosamine N-acyltransferase
VGVVGHSRIGDGAIVTAQSGVPGDVASGATVSGSPAFDNVKWLRATSLFQRLPEIIRDLKGNKASKKDV